MRYSLSLKCCRVLTLGTCICRYVYWFLQGIAGRNNGYIPEIKKFISLIEM